MCLEVMLAGVTFPSQRVGSLEKWIACSGWHFTFFLLFHDTCVCWVSQGKMKNKFCTCFMFFDTLGVRGSSNKHPLAMPQVSVYYRNALLQWCYPTQKSL